VRLVRRDWPDARLWILAYDQDGPELARLRESVSDLQWVELSLNLTGADVTAALARSEVFLRPTDWDGDSIIVREALAVGTRVVASDVSARPRVSSCRAEPTRDGGRHVCDPSASAMAQGWPR
jgi:glycosyltransferase involved in cell wall biosynthesis